MLIEKEKNYREKLKSSGGEKGGANFNKYLVDGLTSTKVILNQEEKFKELENLDKDDSCSDDDDQDDDSDDDSDEDDTDELMRELEKIKQERQQEQERADQLAREKAQEELTEKALTGNPLLDSSGTSSSNGGVKRRWDDDVIFKNQARGVNDNPEKRFINDMLRSDFHRKFMSKYVR